ncbi:MAG: NAD-dependent epimerase/dehydratase family protein [Alistipes sp.]|nr:NAD-dependent epimerase/dehydratase family protein [Alistipes sp.]
MEILVTGCAGFIGHRTVGMLLEQGHTVTGVDNLNDYYDPALKAARLADLGIDMAADAGGDGFRRTADGRLRFMVADVADREQLLAATAGRDFDKVCHLAAQAGVRYSIENPQAYVDANLQGFFNILELCRNRPGVKLVYASSSSVYGNSTEIPYRETNRTDAPVSFYGATKKSNEVLAASYASLYGMETVGLRFFTVYGPWGRPDMAPFLFASSILKGRTINIFNNGDMSRDFTYVDDIAEGVCRVLTSRPATGDAVQSPNVSIYNIGNSQPVKLMEFISIIEKLTGREAIRNYMPMQPGDVHATWADTSLLHRDYGYHPSTPLETGLARFITWYRGYFDI